MKSFNSILKGMVQVLGLMALLAVASAARAEVQNTITALAASSAGNGATVVKVEFAQPLTGTPRDFTINTPPRIALDFPNTTNGLGKSVQSFAEGELRSANIVQAGTRTRLVINLNQMLTYDTKIEGNNLFITLQGKSVAKPESGGVARFAEVKQDAQKHSLRDIDFRRGKNGEGRIQVDLSDSAVGIDIRQQGTSLIVDFLKTSLPRNLQRKLDVVDFATPVQGVDTFAQGDSVRMVIEPKGLWEHAAYQTDNKFIIEVKPVADDPNKLVKGSQIGYAGEKLTLNFQKIDVRDALYIIADFNNENNNPMNLVISDTVSGNLTLRLKDVPWDQALDIILQSRGLDMRKNGNVIQIAPREEIAAKEKIDLTSRQEISDLEELRTESFQLSYQKGDAITKLLAGDKQRILSKRGSTVVDPRTNTLFVQDTPSRLDEVRKLIKQIDVPVRQVMIEARIVEASNKFGRDLGVRLGYNTTDTFKVGNLGGNIGANQVGTPAGVVNPINGVDGGTFTANANTPNVNLPAASAAGVFSMMLFNSSLSKLLSIELSALETDGQGKVISSPRVVTADKVEAIIEQGTEVPYLQQSSSGAANIAFKKAVLSLKVTPQITPDNNVMMQVNVSKDSVNTAGAVAGGAPSINTNKVATEVLVENGGTVVIGGVYIQDEGTSITKVPLLGDVPVLGGLFKRTLRRDDKQELLIFLSPKILQDALNLH